MIAAALVAKKAVEKGLTAKPWVKTSMAPGSQVVTNYYEKAGLWPYLEKLGFHLVGYGCATCIGNSGPLDEKVSETIQEHDLAVAAVLSGNRNFEGRINPDIKMNYLASPPLVVAYALAGTMDMDLTTAEFDLLHLFMRRAGQALSRDQIMENLKGAEWDVFNRTIDVNLSRLRQKLHDNPKSPEFFKTVWGVGYMFIGKVEKMISQGDQDGRKSKQERASHARCVARERP